MFGNKKASWTEQLRVKITDYVDERFEDYRGQISIDLARGLASLAGLIAIWTLAIVCLLFVFLCFLIQKRILNLNECISYQHICPT